VRVSTSLGDLIIFSISSEFMVELVEEVPSSVDDRENLDLSGHRRVRGTPLSHEGHVTDPS
jgi:hypothetical protein